MKFGGGGAYHATQHIYALKKKKKKQKQFPYEACFLVAAGFLLFLKNIFTKKVIYLFDCMILVAFMQDL